MASYDVVVIGTGTAGQTVTDKLVQNGFSVAVAEKSDRPGGICALAGCQAKKWFYEGAETMARSRQLEGKGIGVPPQADWSALLKQKNEFTAVVPDSTRKGLKKAGVDLFKGQARFVDEKTLLVDGRKLTADHFVIAAGARPMLLPIDGKRHVLTSDQFLELESLPRRFVFIGGGFISFEFAHFVARLGTGPDRRTAILEAAPRPLGPFDTEMVSLLTAASRAEGIEVHTNVDISAVERSGDAYRVLTANGQAYPADVVVNGAGRRADVDDLDLDRAGVAATRKGISVNNRMQTTQAHIFAVGDCAATVQLARVADYEAMLAASTIVGDRRGARLPDVDPATIPALLFTYPQYGMVGQTEDALQQKGIAYTKSFASHLSWPTYRRIGMENAAYKILVGTDGHILGAHFLSDNASGMLNTIRLAMLNRIAVQTLYRQSILSPYPTRESDLLYMLKPLSTDD